jgi:hypothetical protein
MHGEDRRVERFNRNGRDCPICVLIGSAGTLVGRLDDGATTQCSDCASCFKVDGAALARLPVAHPTGPTLTHEQVSERAGLIERDYHTSNGVPYDVLKMAARRADQAGRTMYIVRDATGWTTTATPLEGSSGYVRPKQYRAPLSVDDPCTICHQKHCRGHARGSGWR